MRARFMTELDSPSRAPASWSGNEEYKTINHQHAIRGPAECEAQRTQAGARDAAPTRSQHMMPRGHTNRVTQQRRSRVNLLS